MLRPVLGLAALAIGLVGLLVPLLPGIPFLIIAFLLLRRGDGHWRHRWSAGGWSHRARRLRHIEPSHLSGVERVQLRALQGAARVVGHLDRLERRLSGHPPAVRPVRDYE